jgi:hypothetical protein
MASDASGSRGVIENHYLGRHFGDAATGLFEGLLRLVECRGVPVVHRRIAKRGVGAHGGTLYDSRHWRSPVDAAAK